MAITQCGASVVTHGKQGGCWEKGLLQFAGELRVQAPAGSAPRPAFLPIFHLIDQPLL